ncbi:MAG: DUF2851 family protein [Parachlamydiaceae bacterium]|nr:DUF2851 family protein [Parachlamydiaceae bacterium]
MNISYQKLLKEIAPSLAERKLAYNFLAERHLQAVWLEQKYFKGLKTATNEPIEVISPGIWNLEAGPDFRKAHIKIGEHTYFGDVEIHLVDESWQQHQHHVDQRYDQVILHISLWHPRHPVPLATSAGKPFFQVYLENYLTVPIARLAHLIDLDLYPYKKFTGSGRCAKELFKNLSPEAATNLFEKAADWRLARKRLFLAERIASPSERVGAGIAMALGYKNNTEQFLTLFIEMQKRTFQSEEDTFAWLMGMSGFFSSYFIEKWGKSSYYRTLQSHFQSLQVSSCETVRLHLHQIRPLNHPLRRLVVLAKLQKDKSISSLLSKVIAEWNMRWRVCFVQKKWKKLLDLFKSWLPSYEDPYWGRHFLFEDKARDQQLPLLGDNLKGEIVINLFLPLIEAEIEQRGHPDEIAAFQHLYRSLGSSKAGKSSYLVHRFFGNSKKGEVLKSAYAEQGAYQLHYDFCSHFEASCEGCTFVERYTKLISGGSV